MEPLGTRLRRNFSPGRGMPLALVLPALLAGCAPAVQTTAAPSPGAVRALEASVAKDSTDFDALLQLGQVYRRLKRTDQARQVLERAVALRMQNSQGVLFLGLTYEDLGRYAQARQLYTRYLQDEKSKGLKNEVQARMPLIERKELEAAVRDALAREAELGTSRLAPASVAIFPFLYNGGNAELEPLSRALAEMLVTDLSQTQRLTVLERSRVQFLLDELKLDRTGLVDPATAARSGRLLGAGRIVQGRIAGDQSQLQLQAAVVDAANAGAAARTVQQQDALNRLFDLEKRLALDIYGSLGIELTVAERERVNQRPTQNLQAVLAFGRGLEAQDRADYGAAAQQFQRAASLDRGFAAARRNADVATRAASAQATTTDQLGQRAAASAAGPAASLAVLQALVPGANGRDAAPEVLGTEGIGKSTVLEIIIRRN